MQLHLRIETMTTIQAETFINEKTPFQVEEIDIEFEMVIFDVESEADANSLEIALEKILLDKMLNGTFELVETEEEGKDFNTIIAEGAQSYQDYLVENNIELPDPSTLGADGLAMVYGYC